MIELEVTDGSAPGSVFKLSAAVSFIGRAPANEVALDDTHVSGRHARIVQGLNAATLEDLGSTNGTTLIRGDERFPLTDVGDAVELQSGDVIELGNEDEICRLSVKMLEDEGSAQLVSVKKVDEVSAAIIAEDPGRLRALYEAQSKIGRARDLDSALEAITAALFDLVAQATHVTIVLRSMVSSNMVPGKMVSGKLVTRKAVKDVASYLPVLSRARPREQGGPPSDSPSFVPITRSVYRKVLKERAAVLAADAPKEVGTAPSLMAAAVRSTIAVPLWDGDEILGVVQIDNRDAPGMLKPPDLDMVLLIAEQASLAVANRRMLKRLEIAEQQLRQENTFLRDREQQGVAIIGKSDAMNELMSQLDKVVDTNVTVLIEGATGTGKELVASALHHRSRRRDKLFVAQNCAALSENLLESELFGHKRGAFTGASEDKKGLFELADGSTLFLDEITEAPISIQSKLLRALQEGEIRSVGASEARMVNVRIVAATNRNLEKEVEAGRFREDLYYRLKVFPLRVPSLRERRSDIPLLVQHFLDRYVSELGKQVAGISTAAMNHLVAYDWPGNVRELQNEVQRTMIQVDPGDFITPDLLSSRMRKGEELAARAGASQGTLKQKIQSVEKFIIYEALAEHGNNKTSTAKSLGITREGLHKKLRGYER
jgi:transcriptional regulator with GAF, ATPase, and Fis domain